jgi:hypothetical protein
MKKRFDWPSIGPDEARLRADAWTERLDRVGRDPDLWLSSFQARARETNNPYYVWMAIDVCIESKKQFPDWVIAYLTQCLERMSSDKTTKAKDFRSILPWVFGFPTKRGPGKILAPHSGGKAAFALSFALALHRGDNPPTARRNACNKVCIGSDLNVDDRTLQRWLLKEFGLKNEPPTTEEWKRVAREHFWWIWPSVSHLTKSRETMS